jgi:hypothetical protein
MKRVMWISAASSSAASLSVRGWRLFMVSSPG